jgi:hypothetical protein
MWYSGRALTEKNVDRFSSAFNYEGGTRLESLEMRRITGIGDERAEMGRKGVGERF